MPPTLHEQIDGEVASAEGFLHTSEALGIRNVIDGELAEVWDECHEPNWDGYDAKPVTWDAYHQAEKFLLSLPLGTRRPSIGATPDGHVTLEWHHSRRRTLTVIVNPDRRMHYAALLGPNRTHGTEVLFDEVPKRILSLIGQVHSC